MPLHFSLHILFLARSGLPRRPLVRAVAALGLLCAVGPALASPTWAARLAASVAAIDAGTRADVGLYVRDLGDNQSVRHRADADWYIASMVKVPVAIAVLRGVDAGHFTLDTPLRVRASDYVDGAGRTNHQPLATPLPVRYLMEQMLVHSDNTASDMLIGLVGEAQVNDVATTLAPQGFGRITTLAEVRQQVYGRLTPAARHLRGHDLVRLQRQRADDDRLQLLSQLVDVPVAQFKVKSLDAAYTGYYASGLNSARLDAYGDVLQLLGDGKALTPPSTAYLLAVMERAATGTRRLSAGLPPDVRFAHKTGTQRRVACDAGLVRAAQLGRDQRAVVVACVRGELSLARSEAILREIGNAICRSGLLTQGVIDAPSCPVVAHMVRLPASTADDDGGPVGPSR